MEALSEFFSDLYFMIVTVFSLILLQILSLIRSTSWSLRSSHKRWRATRKYQALIEEKIPTFRYRSESMPELIECAVCLSKFQEGEKIRELKCNHVFHKDCLGKWLQHDSATCPLCRSSVLPEKIGVERRESENEGENDGSDEELIFFLSALHGSSFHRASESTPELIECAVFLSKFWEGEKIREVQYCKHIFHKDCLDKWLQHDSATCPLCRSTMLPEKIGVELRQLDDEGEYDGRDEELIFFLSALHGSSFHRAF
ncbi:hypothetical protein HHK36_030629 [Tetracentron sinense]|uniref:RING-type domain-containing protein n=1 Tax=Tetracentron sinense TaxID=13715 RepID=A0A834Y9X4_TETSI|nr:hypothetical protein HHK36_030629 [Tetracentron sinense]